ncbi:MAG: phosphate ABC transporter permease [Candidatus Pacebacteria bacterium RIFOXYA1_FULL_38_18]|nr:MAG: phosphate ABC transporter permease [Candidatus Pacebacteria bacterium RIFOXYA1_FULL_38_18]OGJ39471.1 MAG: phosphate ABC transporter permease [Candidatus Pacebacteria bacterium RIFOXYC1_FULL_39_21]
MSDKVIIIKAKSRIQLIDWREIWEYRELFLVFAWRDIKVRYKQTILGAGWALLQPLFSMFIFTIFFGNFAKIPSDALPYPLFVLIGLIFWGFFSGTLSAASGSLIANESIVKKAYFPREILPLSTIGTNLIDFSISFIMLLLVAVYFQVIPNILALLIIPLGIIIGALGAGGLGLLLSAFNIKYRDVRHALPFFIQMMIFLSPVIYPSSIMRPSFRYLIALNPMAGVIEAVRIVFSGGTSVNWITLAISGTSSILLFIIGYYYFKSTERFFADIV